MSMTLEGPLAHRDRWQATECSIDKAVGVVGTRSALLLLREAFYGTTRFDDFAQRVGITPAVAAARLKDMVGAGILEKRPYRQSGQRTRYEYVLTQRGRDLLPAVLALWQWGDTHLQDGTPPLELVDADNSPIRVAVLNERGEELALEDLHVRPGGRRQA
jgi:DNA-binding HxlR family transcriptional regulator